MENKEITISIIGAGPGGYEAAILAAKLGANVNLIEKEDLGGVCLNEGCIPTKVFLNTAQKIKEIKEIHKFNIQTNTPTFDYTQILQRKDKNIDFLQNGINDLIERNNINLIKGKAKLIDNNYIAVLNNEDFKIYPTDYVILATGSSPIIPKSFNYNGNNIITTDDLFSLNELPESMVIIGGGYAAVEIGQYLARFGVAVTIIEEEKHILPNEDADIVRKFNRILKKDKIKILTKTRVEEIKDLEDHVEVITDKNKIIDSKLALICIGRQPNSYNLFNESLGLKVSSKGFIKVDEYLKTNLDNVYAIGDLIESPMLAHTASHEGSIAVNNILQSKKAINYSSVPYTLYTEPEISSVGLKEDYLKENNIEYKKGTFPFRLLGKSLTLNKQEGLVKILTNSEDKIIGASIFGPNASDLIMEVVLAIRFGLTSSDLTEVIHPHPSLSEAVLEACRDISHLSINKI